MFALAKAAWHSLKWLNLYARVRDCEIDRELLRINIKDRDDRISDLEGRIRLMESFLEIGTIEVDMDGKVVSACETFADMSGYTVEELAGFPMHNLLPTFLQRRHRRFFKQACEGHKKAPAIMLSELRKSDGTPQLVIITICEIIYSSGMRFRVDFRRR